MGASLGFFLGPLMGGLLGQHFGWRAELAFLFLGGNWWIVFVGFHQAAQQRQTRQGGA